MGRHTILTVIIVQAMGLGVLAFAADRGDRERPSVGDREPAAVTRMQQTTSDRKAESLLGTLGCDQGAENTGAACQLKLTERDSGRTFDIRGSNDAMRLFNDGKREVAVEGHASGDQLRVLKIRAL